MSLSAPPRDGRRGTGSVARAVPGPAAPHAPASPTVRQVWRAARGPVLIALVLLLLAVAAVASRLGPPAGYLDPSAVDDAGSRAVATLLADRGTTVRTVHTVPQARQAAGPDTLLLLTRPWLLSKRQLTALRGLPGDRMLVEPTPDTLKALAPAVTATGSVTVSARGPGCDLRAARLAGDADTGGDLYEVGGDVASSDVDLCYPARGKASLVRLTRDGRTVAVLDSGEPLTNGRLDEHGNAALAMNLLGSRPTLVWLLPNLPAAPPRGEGTSPVALLPDGVVLAVGQLAVAVLLLALWRARRLGPVVAEPLPVVVRASETVEGRSRLYRSRRARDSAAEALRAGCRARLAPRLGLSRDASPSALVEAVAARTGRSPVDVGALLYGATPGDDAALVRLADDLDAMEMEVRRP